MRIVDLRGHDPGLISQAATLLLKGFADTGSVSWQTPEPARLSVRESLQEGLPDANGFGEPDIFMSKRVSGGAVVRPQDVQ